MLKYHKVSENAFEVVREGFPRLRTTITHQPHGILVEEESQLDSETLPIENRDFFAFDLDEKEELFLQNQKGLRFKSPKELSTHLLQRFRE